MSLNVFADLGFPDDRAAEMALRVAVAVQIGSTIEQRQLKQHEAAKLFGVPQPTISKIQHLKLERLSLALLLRMLFKAGIPFTLSYGGTPQSIRARVGSARAGMRGQSRSRKRRRKNGSAAKSRPSRSRRSKGKSPGHRLAVR